MVAIVLLLGAYVEAVPSTDRPVVVNRPVVVIEVDASINPAVADFVEQSISAAQARKARALVIELDTPGGLLSTTRRLVEDLLGAPLPVIVYVAPSGASAASAGMFVTSCGEPGRDGARHHDRRGASH